MLRILGAGLEPPRTFATVRYLLTAVRRGHAAPAGPRRPPPPGRGHLTLCTSAAAPQVAEQRSEAAMSYRGGRGGGRGQQAPMRGPAGSSGPRQQPNGTATGNAGNSGNTLPAAGGNRTSSTTKAHLTNVRFDELNLSANTKRCVACCMPFCPDLVLAWAPVSAEAAVRVAGCNWSPASDTAFWHTKCARRKRSHRAVPAKQHRCKLPCSAFRQCPSCIEL